MEPNEKALAEAINVVNSLPKPKFETFEAAQESKGQAKCACKQKWISITEIRPVVTPLGIEGTDSTCAECLKTVKGMCPIFCAGCREVVSYLAPGKDPDGFERERGKIYHIRDCPKCNPDKFDVEDGEAVETILVEKEAHMRVVRKMKL